MSLKAMYAARINSPITQLATNISAGATQIILRDGSVLPPAPNLFVIFKNMETRDAETVKYTSLINNVATVERGFQGTAKAWDAGATVARAFTAYDHDTFKENIETLNSDLAELSKKMWSDFMYDAAQSFSPWHAENISSGTKQNYIGTSKHPGVIVEKSSTSANSGVTFRLNTSCILLSGGESTTIVFKTGTTTTGITRLFGFLDKFDGVTTPDDGVYCKVADGVLTGQTASNAVSSTTGSNYTLTTDTWYRLVIQLNADATLAIYTLYADDSDTVLWTDTLSDNIPTATGRETGHGSITISSGTSVIFMSYIDYMDIILPNARRV